MLRLISSLMMVLMAPITGAASVIDWETPIVSKSAPTGATEMHFSIPFTNRGAAPVTILKVRPGCDCTNVNLKKVTYAPGESGIMDIRVELDYRRPSPQNTSIILETDEANDNVSFVQLNIHLKKHATVSPRMLVWQKDEARTAKTVRIEMEPEAWVEFTGLTGPAQGFSTKVRAMQPRGLIEVDIVPPVDGTQITSLKLATGAPTKFDDQLSIVVLLK